MPNDRAGLAGKTILMSGGSRGIGLAIAVRAARDGANVALLAKTDGPAPQAPGDDPHGGRRDRAGGWQGPGIVGDVRDDAFDGAVAHTVERFGGIDICVNNASRSTSPARRTSTLKRYDLMQDINTRGTFMLSRLHPAPGGSRQRAHPDAEPADQPRPRSGSRGQLAYTIAKYGMSLCTLGLAEELRDRGIAANSLWPRTLIATAAVLNLLGGDAAMPVADA